MFTRRRFLCGATATALAVPAFMRGLAAEAAGNTILVSILLDGSCDGLNTVVPLNQYGIYSQLRKIPGTAQYLSVLESDVAAAGTAFEANYTVPSSSAVSYAFHPNMTALRALYGQGKMPSCSAWGCRPRTATAPATRSRSSIGRPARSTSSAIPTSAGSGRRSISSEAAACCRRPCR